jgi:hypothetical protein
MATKKTTPKKLTKIELVQRKNDILQSALLQAYADTDETFGLLYLIIKEIEKPEPNLYQLRQALQAFRTLLFANQSNMMDYAGIEY